MGPTVEKSLRTRAVRMQDQEIMSFRKALHLRPLKTPNQTEDANPHRPGIFDPRPYDGPFQDPGGGPALSTP